MLRVCRAVLVALVAAVLLLAGTPAVAADTGPRVLVFTKSSDPERAHLSTTDAAGLIEMSGRRYGFDTEVTDEASVFTPDRLAGFDVVLWLNNYGDVLDDDQQAAFADWVSAGGGFVGVHGAARAEPEWDDFTDLIGTRVTTPENAPTSARSVNVDAEHPAAQDVPTEISDHEDQWLEPDRDPSDLRGMDVLATAQSPGGDEKLPVAWCRDFDGGRTWFTTLGHRAKPFEDGDFMQLLRGGIWWSAGVKGEPKVDAAGAAPAWPYGLSFLAWIGAVAVGGGIAVVRLNRRDGLP